MKAFKKEFYKSGEQKVKNLFGKVKSHLHNGMFKIHTIDGALSVIKVGTKKINILTSEIITFHDQNGREYADRNGILAKYR